MKNFLLIFSIIFSLNSKAEYRVYQYEVKSNLASQNSRGIPQIITSNLSPVSYQSYNGGSTTIKITLLRTWLCPGDTAKTQFCPSPFSKLLQEEKNEN